MKTQFKNLEGIDRDIAEYLKDYCDGIYHSISNEGLAHKFDIDVRTMRNLVANIIAKYELPIGSTSKNLSGIFWIKTEDEFEIAHRELISRIKKLSKRAKGVRRGWQAWKNEIEAEQLTLSGVGK